jgi:hypothetical protein
VLATADVVLIVRLLDAGRPAGVTLAGWNWQLKLAGSPEQENVTGLEKLPTGVTVIVKFADVPGDTVCVVGVATIEKPDIV